MLSVNALCKYYGGRTLFENVSFQVGPRDKVGLAGRNGAGKSTLLKMMKGLISPDKGDISSPNDYFIGYLPQDLSFTSQITVMEEARKAFERILKLQADIDEIQHQLETRTDYESDGYMQLINDLSEKQMHLHIHDTAGMDEQIEKILIGLGFEHSDLGRQVKEFSGGWQMRVELAKILLQQPDLILLDEPTNHLDIESIIWLENFLKSYDGACIIISHDKTFLDNLTNRTIEISLGKIEDYKANYSQYLEMRKQRRELQAAAKKNQDREIAQIERNIEKFRAKASKAAFAQSLIKKMDKLDIIEVDETDNTAIRFRFPEPPRSGKVVVKGKDVVKSYGEKKVIRKEDFEIERGDKVAFVGKNGMGKTTLSRMIAGDLSYEGELNLGHNVALGYYAQHQADTLSGDKTVFQTIDDEAVGDMRTRVRNLLGAFLFSGEDVDKKVRVLSGGEKSRLALAKLLLQPINLLILDEPTNHLDLVSKEMLKEALMNYDGTLIVVSHDRDFLQGLTNKVFEFTAEGIRKYPGTINDFLERRQVVDFRNLELEKERNAAEKKAATAAKEAMTAAPQKKENKSSKNRLKQVEQKINELETAIAKCEAQLKDPEQYKLIMSDNSFYAKYDGYKKELDAAMAEWESLAEE